MPSGRAGKVGAGQSAGLLNHQIWQAGSLAWGWVQIWARRNGHTSETETGLTRNEGDRVGSRFRASNERLEAVLKNHVAIRIQKQWSNGWR